MKKQIKLSLSAGAALLLCSALCGCSSQKINLNDYLTTEFKGYDTVGTASYDLDIDAIVEDYPEAFGLDPENPDDIDKFRALADLHSTIDGELSENKNLSNGDEVIFEWDELNTEKLEEKYDVKFSYSDVTYSVSELEEAKSFNPFDYITVTFNGTAPNGTVNIERSNDIPVRLSFNADKSNGLRNGDIVTVSAGDMEDIYDNCLSYGMIPSENEKSYIVEGLASYAMKLSEIPEETLDKIKGQAEDSINAYASGWSEGNSLNSVDFMGYYFLAIKDGFNAARKNMLYCVYKLDTTMTGVLSKEDSEKSTGDETYYTYFFCDNIMLLPDGTCSLDLSAGSLCYEESKSAYGSVSWFSFYNYEVRGYKDLDSMFNNCVTAQIETYTYENTVNG